MHAELKVVAGENAGATFKLQQRPHAIVLHQGSGKPRVELDSPNSAGPRPT